MHFYIQCTFIVHCVILLCFVRRSLNLAATQTATLYLFLYLGNSWQPIHQPGDGTSSVRRQHATAACCLIAKWSDFSMPWLPPTRTSLLLTRIFRSWCNYARDLIRSPFISPLFFERTRKINLFSWICTIFSQIRKNLW